MWKVYGSRVSYYTGKLEAYLRYKGIPYQSLPTPYGESRMLVEKVGAVQMPIVERDDGRWMSDTTPILLQLERERPEPAILPGARWSASLRASSRIMATNGCGAPRCIIAGAIPMTGC